MARSGLALLTTAVVALAALPPSVGSDAGTVGNRAAASAPSDGEAKVRKGLGAHELPARVRVRLTGAGSVRVVVRARAALPPGRLALSTYASGRSTRVASLRMPAMARGTGVTRTVAIDRSWTGDLGLIAALEARRNLIGQTFIAARRTSAGLVTAGSFGLLDEAQARAARAAGQLTKEEYAAEVSRIAQVSGSGWSRLTTDARRAAGDFTVTGRAQYTDRSGGLLPVRSAKVNLVDSNGMIAATARTSSTGYYTLTGTPVGVAPQSFVVRLVADAGGARVLRPDLLPWFVDTEAHFLGAGDSWSAPGIALSQANGADRANAFAILDAASTVSAYYATVRRTNWDAGFDFTYPSSDGRSFASRATHRIAIAGGVTQCTANGTTDWCQEDAYDWDVVAHETGHVVAYQAEIDTSPGGKHFICRDASIKDLGDLTDLRGKGDAMKLAWSEGWATFWGMVALQTQGVPPGLPENVGNIAYNDRSGPPHWVGGDIDYSMETGAECQGSTYRGGETNEVAVQRALWDMWDSADDGEGVDWSTSDMFTRLWDARATTFESALAALTAGRTTAEKEVMGSVLEQHYIAPSKIALTAPNAAGAPAITWEVSGPEEASNLANTYTVRVRTPAGVVLATNTQKDSNQYRPTVDDWQSWATYGSIVIDVSETRTLAAPTTGPYRSAPKTIAVPQVGDSAFSYQPWETGFTASQSRGAPADQIDFAGHPLDVTFDSNGTVWGVGEFGLAAASAEGPTISRHGFPLLAYFDQAGNLLDWTKPFASSWGGHGSGSELNESIIRAGSSVWVASGGQQKHDAIAYNHSLLTRYDANNPNAIPCGVPLPGDNNEVIGLTHDTKRNRVWFLESEGDHRQGAGSGYGTIGWVKASGLGSRCQAFLDYGGDPRRTAAQDAQVRAAAQTTINGLQCTPAQESNASADCVHIIKGTSLPTGGAHMTYDPAADALWMTNWFTSKLTKFNIATGNFTTYTPPASNASIPVAWQVEANDTHVYFNEYAGNRILRFTKSSGTWSQVRIPYGLDRQVHSIALDGTKLWFTVSDEDYDAATALGYVDLNSWGAAKKGVIYTGWKTLSMHPNAKPGNKHSFRGIEVKGSRIALADHGDVALVTLTKK